MMAQRTWFCSLGSNRDTPRLWIEGPRRLNSIGFAPGTEFRVEPSSEHLTLRTTSPAEGTNRISSRRGQPILDILSKGTLGHLSRFTEVVVRGSYGRLQIKPSIRAANILHHTAPRGEYRILELFAGGGTLGHAITHVPGLSVAAAAEINSAYADIYCANHPSAEIIEGNIRTIAEPEYPDFDILTAGIPCTCHSTMGRTKNRLKGRPEIGEQGDLFIPVLSLIQRRMPRAVVIENVPSFGTSLAGELLKSNLQKLGYHLFEQVLEPLADWKEIQNRRRWVLVATLQPGFAFTPTRTGLGDTAGSYLDAPDPEQDAADCERIAGTIEGLRRHNARHQAKGNGFRFSTIDRSSPVIHTIPRSYAKINTGPFVETPFGLRLMRQSELARIFGCTLDTPSFRLAAECYGQGLQTRIFSEILRQLYAFLGGNEIPAVAADSGLPHSRTMPTADAGGPVQTTLF